MAFVTIQQEMPLKIGISYQKSRKYCGFMALLMVFYSIKLMKYFLQISIGFGGQNSCFTKHL